MMYEEKCQLGFASSFQNDFFYSGQDEDDHINNHSHQGYNMRGYYSGQDEKENLNVQMMNTASEYQIKTGSEPKTLLSEAALKLNFDKKVRFAEQLSFKVQGSVPLLAGEEPLPIQFKNNLKPGIPKKGKGKKGAKQQNKSSGNVFIPLSLKRRPGSAVKSKAPQALPEWNQDSKAQKFFDPKLDKNNRNKYEETNAKQIKQNSVVKGAPVVTKNFEEGKYDIAFMKSNGQAGSKFQIYKDIDSLANDTQKPNYASSTYSMKKIRTPSQTSQKKHLVATTSALSNKKSPTKINRDIQITHQSYADRDEVNTHAYIAMRKQENTLEDQEAAAYHSGTEVKLHHLVGEALTHKEDMIMALEQELEKEKSRRVEMTNKFKSQLNEYEGDKEAIEKLKQVSGKMERDAHSREQQIERTQRQIEEGDLDMVPTREKSTSKVQKSKTNLPKRSSTATFRSSRVKTSIPQINTPRSNARRESAKYIEELKKQEIQRTIKLQQEEEATTAVLQRFRDNPNSQLHTLSNEVSLLQRKVEPLLQRVEQAAKNITKASGAGIKSMPGPISMLSKMGGRLISFYADDLAELLLDDFLGDTAMELQKIEKVCKKDYAGEEAKNLAEELLKNLVDYQSEENFVEMRWNNPAFKKQLRPIGLDGLIREPKPIAFNLNEDLETVAHQAQSSAKKSLHESSQVKSKYQHPFGRVDPFSQSLAEISASAPDVSYNMMQKLDPTQIAPIQSSGLEMKGGKEFTYEQKRKYRVEIDKDVLSNITSYKDKFDKFLKMHNNTSNKDVWKIYDHLTDDLFHEALAETMKSVNVDLEQYIEKVIFDEFQLS